MAMGSSVIQTWTLKGEARLYAEAKKVWIRGYAKKSRSIEMRKRQQNCQIIQFLPLIKMLLMDIGNPAKDKK